MKKIAIIIMLSLFITKLTAASLDKFEVQAQYLTSGKIKVSSYENAEFKVDIRITRPWMSYGYENIDWIVTVVYQRPGYADVNLSTPLNYTVNNTNTLYNDRTITCVIPQNLVGVNVKLKYEYYTYDASGYQQTGLGRSTAYSTVTYVSGYPPTPTYNASFGRLVASNPSGSNFRKLDFSTGGFLNVSSDWAGIEAMTSKDGFLYVVQAGTIHKVNPVDFSYTIIGVVGDWIGTDAIAVSDNGYIYVVQNSRVHKVNQSTGVYTILGSPEWQDTEGMVAYNGSLYIVQASYLYMFNENTGSYVELGIPDWGGTKGMISTGDGNIYIVQNGYLHKVNSANGSWVTLGGQVWGGINSRSLAFYNGDLYIISDKKLWKINKSTGTREILGEAAFEYNSHLTGY